MCLAILGSFQVQNGTGSEYQEGPSQIPPALRNFSMSQKEKTLDELVRDNWLCHTPDGAIGLGARSYLDLRSWFNSSGIPSCEVCNEAGVKVLFLRPSCVLFNLLLCYEFNLNSFQLLSSREIHLKWMMWIRYKLEDCSTMLLTFVRWPSWLETKLHHTYIYWKRK
jgi:hypothetical protein